MLKTKKIPEFKGAFAELCKSFIAYKKALGLKYESETKVMSRFSMFAHDYGISEPILSKELADKWIEKRPNEKNKTREHRHSIIRQFATYLNSLGHPAYIVPPMKGTGSRYFVPYIFTHEEMERIFKNADNIKPRKVSPYIHKILPVLLRLLYGCGMRISEALQLKEQDVNLEQGILTIRNAKFDQDRLIPMNDTLTEVCRSYRTTMSLLSDDYFFPARDGSQISPLTIYNRFREILWASNISYNGSGKGPRLHDVRHTFAVHTLRNDIYCMLPMLSVYLGHQSTSSTGRYLRLTAEVYPEIVAITSENCGYVIPSVRKTVEEQAQ